jgi:hypothetical protein
MTETQQQHWSNYPSSCFPWAYRSRTRSKKGLPLVAILIKAYIYFAIFCGARYWHALIGQGGDGRSPVAVFDISKGTATRSEHRQVEIEFRRTRKVEQIAELLSHIMLLFDGASLVLEPSTSALGENRDRGELEQQFN